MTLLLFSVLGTWSATSAGHRLAEGWVHTTSTKVSSSSALLGTASKNTEDLLILGQFGHVTLIARSRLLERHCSKLFMLSLHLQVAKVCCGRHRFSGISCADNND